MSSTKLIHGDCIAEMAKMPDKSVDLFICDFPYLETNCAWDQKGVNLEKFWIQFKRIRKSKRTACIHFCSTKFGYKLIQSNEKMFKMDMVWKKRNKTGGLVSRYRPMRNHEMVYFFYEQAPKYNRDKYHKRINNVKHADSDTTGEKKAENTIIRKTIPLKERKAMGEQSGIYEKNKMTFSNFEPPNPASVLEEKYTQEHLDNNRGGAGTNGINEIFTKENQKKFNKENGSFEPPNPASVLEEKIGGDIYGEDKESQLKRRKGAYLKSGNVNTFEPPNPSSVLEEKKDFMGETKSQREKRKNARKALGTKRIKGLNDFDPPNPSSVVEEKTDIYGESKSQMRERSKKRKELGEYDIPNPASVVEELIEPAEDEPKSMFESAKVFIGKRNHQTEKPVDILQFFLKYWSDPEDVICDPTMGSGSTGVACKELGRNFIGIELNDEIFKVAENRINNS